MKMNEELRETWVAVHKAEGRLVRTGMRLRPKDAPDLREGLEIAPDLQQVFARTIYGFAPKRIRAQDYLARYPLSNVNAIERQLRALVEAGVFTGPHGDAYAVTDEAEAYFRLHTERVGESVDRLDLGDIDDEQVRKLLAYDHRILDGIRESTKTDPSPIFEHRLKGLRLEYDPPKRWHHWQLAWTMVAAHEDAEKDCQAAIETMRQRGWIEGEGDACRLTEQELERADRDEAEIEELFFARWPDFTDAELAEMRGIADAINLRCEELAEQAEGQS